MTRAPLVYVTQTDLSTKEVDATDTDVAAMVSGQLNTRLAIAK